MNTSISARSHGVRGGLDPAAILLSFVAVALASGAVLVLRPFAPLLSLGVLYLFAVLALALARGPIYALAVALASLLAFNFLFLPPVDTLAVRDSGSWVALAMYLVAAVVITELVGHLRRRVADAEQHRLELAFEAEVAAVLLRDGRLEDRLPLLEAPIAERLGARHARIELGPAVGSASTAGEVAFELAVGRYRVGRLILGERPRARLTATRRACSTLAALLAPVLEQERSADAAREADELRRSDAIKTTVLRSLSHDLRSPLTTITAASELLAEESDTLGASQRAELIANIRLETRRLSTLVANLLDLARLEVGAARTRPELWTVDGLLARTLAALGAGCERVSVSLSDTLPVVLVDPAALERVLVNLLENALRFSGADALVEVNAAVGATELTLRIVDHGPGLEPAQLERIFEPFHHGAGVRGGSGLGLAIARGFAAANGGWVRAEPTPGGGATFAVTLPLAGPRAQARP